MSRVAMRPFGQVSVPKNLGTNHIYSLQKGAGGFCCNWKAYQVPAKRFLCTTNFNTSESGVVQWFGRPTIKVRHSYFINFADSMAVSYQHHLKLA